MSVLRTEYNSFLADQRKASMLDTCGYTISLRKQCLAGFGPAISPRSILIDRSMGQSKPKKNVAEIPVIGDVDDWESEVVKALLELPPRGECIFYIDSAGGSVFGSLAVLTLMRHRKLTGTAIVLGECSSAAILLFAACKRRFVTPYSTLLFHRMRWQSEKRVGAEEAYLWAKHFEELEKDIDNLQIRLFGAAPDEVRSWTSGGHYVTGPQMVAAGLAELLEM